MKMTYLKFASLIIGLLGISVFPLQSALAQVPDEFTGCIPSITSFTASPVKVLKRDQPIKLTVKVRTTSCIIDQKNGVAPKWNVLIQRIDDNGRYYEDNKNYNMHGANVYMSSSDFKRVNNNTQSSDYNKYDAVYTIDITDLYANQTGTTISLRSNLFWETTRYKESAGSGFTYKISAPVPSVVNANINKIINAGGSTGANVNTNVGVKYGIDLDENIGSFFNPTNFTTLPQLITIIIRILFSLIGILAVIIIIVSGFKMVIANGNQNELAAAKKAITWAIIGLIVSLMAFSIVAIVQRLIQFGAN